MRTLVDINAHDIAQLDALAEQTKQSRAALIRAAISDYLKERHRIGANDAYGLWGEGKVDGLAFQKKMRSEW